MTDNKLKLLVCTSLILLLIYYYIPYLYVYIYDSTIIEYLFNPPLEPLYELSRFQVNILFIFNLIALFLLFFDIKGGKYFFLFMILVGVALSMNSGITSLTSFDLIVTVLRDMVNGVIIYVTFLERAHIK